MTWARIVSPGVDYQLTTEDVVWAARMVVGEGDEDTEALLWAMTQRYALGAWSTFTELLRAYSQPINPLWYPSGACCQPGGAGCPTGGGYGTPACSERAFGRRARITHLTWEEIPLRVRRIVLTWAEGKLPNPVPRATHFAAPRLVERRLSPTYQLVYQGRSWFAADRRSLGWPDDYVTMQPGRPVWPWVVAGVVGVAALGGLLLWRSR